MKFGEKVKELRLKKGMSQDELAAQMNVSRRTICSYETGNAYPRKQELYDKLAVILEVSVDYLRTENENFLTQAAEQYGVRGQLQAKEILAQTAQLFAGGTLSEEDEAAFMLDLQQIYWDSKKRAKKYTPKKYLDEDPSEE